jgi:nitroimidazol reductase NimA-like FMN-containing flavoprotein (pyridoxamine 5'-phosphate oxidase superfamily)
MPHPHNLDIAELSDRQCRDRLRLCAFGRVALSWRALPVIFPIHFAMLGDDPVFRTDPGTKLMAASVEQVLCLEVDEIHPELHTGWSVLATGRAHVISDAEELATARALPLRPWTGSGSSYVRIRTELLSGREIGPPHDLQLA